MWTRLLMLLALQVGLSHCFPWDIVIGGKGQIEFYFNGTLTYTEDIPSHKTVRSLIYDPVQYRVLFAYQINAYIIAICSFDVTTKTTQSLYNIQLNPFTDLSMTYDPTTRLLFWSNGLNLYSFTSEPVSPDKSVDGNLFLALKHYCRGIAIVSFKGFIYWITDEEIERARFDGSQREVLVDNNVYLRTSLAIDQQTQTMYWAEENANQISIESADLNGKNRKTVNLLKDTEQTVAVLTVSEDFVYWKQYYHPEVWQYSKYPPHHIKTVLMSSSNKNCGYCLGMATNYTNKKQNQDTKICQFLKSLSSNSTSASNTADMDLLCVHGKKVSQESRCECTHGYTGDRCETGICQNYCLRGDCSVSADGLPICRCKPGYSGERCEVHVCHKHCLNNGVCSLNDEHEPVCKCAQDYEGDRCDVPAFLVKCIQTVSTWRDMLYADLTSIIISKGVKSTLASTVV